MTKKKTGLEPETIPVYIAHVRRNEVNGETYNRGDTTNLDGYSAEQIGYLVGNSYFGVLNPDTLPEDVAEAIENERKG